MAVLEARCGTVTTIIRGANYWHPNGGTRKWWYINALARHPLPAFLPGKYGKYLKKSTPHTEDRKARTSGGLGHTDGPPLGASS
eukprot:649959-Prorocentrum_minimum.AAC.6